MKVTKVCCQGCGADLQIDETIRYVTCNYCNARLEIIHDTTVTHSRQLDKIERTTDQLAGKLKVLELQNDIERLDREWEKFREAVLSRDEKGLLCEPSAASGVLTGMAATLLGIVMLIAAISNEAYAWIFVALGVFPIAFLVMRRSGEKARAYQSQRYRYSTARKSLLHRLEKARR